jgi:hypothetical protein
MSEEKIIEAIHKLELNLTDRVHVQTTVIEVNNERLENLRIAVDRHREILFGHDDGEKTGLLSDMHELKNMEQERRLTLRTVSAAFVAAVGKICYDIFNA